MRAYHFSGLHLTCNIFEDSLEGKLVYDSCVLMFNYAYPFWTVAALQ